MSELWQKYIDYTTKISAYNLATNVLYFEMSTTYPKKALEYCYPRFSILSGEAFELSTSDELYQMLKDLEKENLNEQQRQIVYWQLREFEKNKHIPKDVFVRHQQLMMESERTWEEAKQKNDYSLFKPTLLKVIEDTKELLKYRPDGHLGYDALLGDYEPDMTMKKCDEFFGLVKEKLVPLIAKINKQKQFDDSFVYKFYPAEKQKEFSKVLMKYIDFDFDAGLLEESEHPFTCSMSKFDNRITTHYYENYLTSSIFSIIHESGHANYNRNVADEIAETYLFDNMSMGMHESQSRLFENYLGRNEHFWDNLFEPLKQIFPEQLKDVTKQQFIDAINISRPSLIRTEADELTYPLHILIRYEMEKGIFDGTIDLENLDKAWNEKYKQYLGVVPATDAEGILQDMHWSGGGFGYFPTYALGSAYGAQFMHAMRKDIDVEKCLANNEFVKIKEWLAEHIHKYGGTYTPAKQIEIATGESFNPNYYIEYLCDKYSKLYNIK